MIFDHIGIITDDIDTSLRMVINTFGASGFTDRFDDEELGVSARFIRDLSGLTYELIAPYGQQSPVARILKSKANLLNQIAYRTDNLAQSIGKLREAGNLPLGPAKSAKAFGGAAVQFFWSDLGFVVEIIEAMNYQHRFLPLHELNHTLS